MKIVLEKAEDRKENIDIEKGKGEGRRRGHAGHWLREGDKSLYVRACRARPNNRKC